MSDAGIEPEAKKRLNVSERLQFAISAVAVLRSLELTDNTMQYGQLARAIGLIPSTGSWKPWHRQQVAEILQVVAAVERQSGNNSAAAPVQFERIVTKDGQPGAGVTRDTRIVSTAQPVPSPD
ncbi:hypothetical protein MKK58_04535 [Methylobacterium sp. J-078]|uniref:hypothetical protein n=1 Tax=Methylobacterium sp. J-078 TaxID=2836657 RepID=UPI001FBB6EA9|nr:hypothetical protein [Methylobacterium sp. J-078]MCJ2043804.1 hypothetical protein [Methylobacterium sp. J-078]